MIAASKKSIVREMSIFSMPCLQCIEILIAYSTKCLLSLLRNLVKSPNPTSESPSPYRFEGGDAEIVLQELAVVQGEIIELDDEDVADDEDKDFLAHHEVINSVSTQESMH